MIEIEAPDGSIIEFPAGTPDDVITRVMRQSFPGPSAPQEAGRTLGQTIYENVIGSGEVDTPGERIGELIRGLGAGASRGVMELAGLPGTIGGLMDVGAQKAGLLRQDAPPSPVFSALSGAGIRDVASDVTGGATEYRAPGTAGDFAATIGEFLPGAAMMGGAGNIARLGVVPGAASEAAGQATEGTAAEPYARVAGALLGPMAVGAAEKGLRAAISPYGGADPERLKLAKVLDDFGVPVTAGQRVGSENLRRVEGATSRGQAIAGQQQEAFTREVLKTAGVTADRATPDVMQKAFRDLGGVFDDVVQGVDVMPDPSALTKMSGALQTYRALTPSAAVPPILNNVNKELVRAFRSGNAIPAATVKNWRSTLSKLTKSSDAATREAAIAAIDAVDDTISGALIAAGKPEAVAKLATARGQYRNLLAIEKAATGAGEGAASGLLSPSAVRNAVVVQGRGSYARGNRGDLGELARAAEGVIKPLPRPGTAGELTAMGVPMGIGVGAGSSIGAAVGGPAGAALGGIAGAALPPAIRAAKAGPLQGYLANQLVSPSTRPVVDPRLFGAVTPGLLAQ